MKKIKIELEQNSYYFYFGKGILEKLALMLKGQNITGKLLFVIDKNAAQYHLDHIIDSVKQYSGDKYFLFVKPGEASKSHKHLNKIYQFLLENKADRHSTIIAVGGGVVGDLAGYAASTFMRGINLIHLPTTLLSMVDSSIGGKTGINFLSHKNIIGTFYQPKFVLADINFLTTLPSAEIKSGAGEILKYAFLVDEDLYNLITEKIELVLKLDEKALTSVLPACAAVKAAVTSQDEKEGGIRKILNLGHTFAHALESDMNFSVKHGEAVTVGLISALCLSNRLNIITEEEVKKHLQVFKNIRVSSKFLSTDVKNIYKLMLSDKKNKNGTIKFVLPSTVGTILIDVEAGKKDVIKSIQRALKFILKS